MPDYYDTPEQLNEYLVFHYGADQDILNWDFGPKKTLGFHRRLVDCIDFDALPGKSRALDLGCSVGRITFELARHVNSVLGIDYSHQFIDAARDIQETGKVHIRLTREGDLSDRVSRLLDDDIDRSRVAFQQGDAENLPEDIGEFDVLVLANVLDRLPHPRTCLRKLNELVVPGGQMVICSPFTWWDDFTEKSERLGGYVENNREVTSLDTMKSILTTHFKLKAELDQPFLIRQHERKYFFSVAQTTVWVRNR